MLANFKSIAKLASSSRFSYAPAFKFSIVSENAGQEAVDSSVKEVKTRRRKASGQLKNVALVLSGSGVYDGSEITEAVSFLISFGSRKINYQCFAPNKNQSEVINHLTGEKLNETRNVLVEAARIARGNIKDIKELKPSDYDSVFFPGGFGAAKNLSDFASKGTELTVDPEVERVLKEFHENSKPIGLACISPVLAAKVFGSSGKKVKLTVGDKGDKDVWPYQGTIEAIEQLGATHSARGGTEVCADARNRIFTVPAFMKNTTNFHEIYEGIDNLVGKVDEALGKEKGTKAAKKQARKEKKEAKAAEQKANEEK